FMAPLAFGFWLIHGGVFASLIGGVVQQTRGLWAFGLWLRILSVVAASRLWLASSPPPLLIRSLLASSLPASFAFLLPVFRTSAKEHLDFPANNGRLQGKAAFPAPCQTNIVANNASEDSNQPTR
ncbi:MAG: hypothetical protein GX635_00045, partial [Synergistaceae bacterium]|nr:hypothetical protein [Synergistaceae bacterium]